MSSTAPWQPAKTAGSFTDPNLPAGFAPFNVAHIGGSLLVAYAKQHDSKSDDVARRRQRLCERLRP